jgi:putative amino-acid transport system ATP-binding protein
MIKVRDLHKSFGSLEVLKGIDLEVEKGEVIVIIGPSGSGKSTFLRCLNFLEQPNNGSIKIGDLDVDVKKASKKDIHSIRKHSAWFFKVIICLKTKLRYKTLQKPY